MAEALQRPCCRRFNASTVKRFNHLFISNSHFLAHPPGGGPLPLSSLVLNPFLELPRRKSFGAHQPLAASRSFGHRASLASASQSSLLAFRQDYQLQTTTPP